MSAPRIVALGCMHACRAEAAPGVVAVPCGGRIDVTSLLWPFVQGADGVLVLSCHADRCLHRGGSGAKSNGSCAPAATQALEMAWLALDFVGLDRRRLGHQSLSPEDIPSEAIKAHGQRVIALPADGFEGSSSELIGELVHPSGSVDGVLELVAALFASKAGTDSQHAGPEGVETLLWPGCRALRRELSGFSSSAEISEATLGRVGGAVAPQRCCGANLLAREAGEVAFSALAKDNAALIAASGAKKLVTLCGGCARVLGTEYPRIGAPLDVEVIDLASFVAGEIAWAKELREALLSSALLTCPRAGLLEPASIASGSAVIELSGCEGPGSGPALRSKADELGEELARRGLSRAVTTCSHCATRYRAVYYEGGWRGAHAMPEVDDLVEVILAGGEELCHVSE